MVKARIASRTEAARKQTRTQTHTRRMAAFFMRHGRAGVQA